ncbi:MAG: hypothetical protein OEQ53_08300 [Saprospiraceae bacterium]|nr:hypothetical protein [Saprospiraceae bacterium]
MKQRTVFLSIILLIVSVSIGRAQSQDQSTHMLDLFTADVSDPVQSRAMIYSEQQRNYISVQLQGNTITTEIIETNPTEYKFQLSEIREKGLVSIQFIGSGVLTEKVVGQFTATVDGVTRKDMSGRFSLVRYQDQTRDGNKIGGHFGVVQPLVNLQKGIISSNFSTDSDYVIGFPMGVTVRKNSNFAFDLEIVPSITFIRGEVNQENVNLLIHPGLLWGVGKNLTFGTRLAFELGDDGRYGITPLLNLGNIFPGGFAELVLPIRAASKEPVVIGLGIHLGVGF